MPVYVKPVWIVKGAPGNPSVPGQGFGSPGYGRSAFTAELGSQPTAAFVRMVLIGLQRTAQEFHILVSKIHADSKGTTGAMLAKRAVTGGTQSRAIRHPITNGAAKAFSFMNFRHGIDLT